MGKREHFEDFLQISKKRKAMVSQINYIVNLTKLLALIPILTTTRSNSYPN